MGVQLELADIQGTLLRNRPMPYHGAYVALRIDDGRAARAMLARLLPHVTSAADWEHPAENAWINVVFTCEGLRRLGLPAPIVEGFPIEFRQGMAARKAYLGDVGPSDPQHWNFPHAGTGFHIGLLVMATSPEKRDEKVATGMRALEQGSGISLVTRLDVGLPPTLREHFGFADGISRPYIDGQGGAIFPGQGDPVKAGEFILGYENELGRTAAGPGPEVLWRNGTYIAIRKLGQRVAAFRDFLRENSRTPEEQEKVAAKMMGRWRSGCPLALSPDRDVPELAADPQRNNDFAYFDDDPQGLKTPVGSHIRRVNPRDALKEGIVDARLHRVLRRGSTYGPLLPQDAVEDDGVDRGIVIAIINADPGRQFEFVQSQWINDGDFISHGSRSDPVVGRRDLSDDYIYPERPVRRHLLRLPDFTVTRGGEHVFLPGLKALRWLTSLEG